jgi:hypothetical protein
MIIVDTIGDVDTTLMRQQDESLSEPKTKIKEAINCPLQCI